MIDASTLVAFLLINTSFALIPGPDMMCILTNSITRGTSAGVKVCAGIASGTLVHVTAATLGLTAFLAAVPTAFFVVKAAGAAYLVWLGWHMLRRPVAMGAALPQSRWKSPFAQGAISSLLNPKIAIFFLAILPQFVHPAQGHPGLQAAVLGLVSVLGTLAVNTCTATLSGQARRWLLAKPRIFQRFQQAAGGVLIGLGLKVAFERSR